ncbi:hypothetical protein ymoll0001_34340 [Yersinia mollaretii ATCC 43969]|uniref:Uncharacterized protein n=1 Tax=Yersinia mollaretii (strain ATCC 43969 / DSM 18520 / CIP 103324 / CNY 7263 / WAIP 204) TaxID=349967 RepID=A0ABP2EH15_YERMW|nr:hypothetical protein ymoll0001_34340 [Yersinia mollaretii ATCC 43969]
MIKEIDILFKWLRWHLDNRWQEVLCILYRYRTAANLSGIINKRGYLKY